MSLSLGEVLSEKGRSRWARNHSFRIRAKNIKIIISEVSIGFCIVCSPNLELDFQGLPARIIARNLGAPVLGALCTGGLPVTHSGAGAKPKHAKNKTESQTPFSCVQDNYIQPCLIISLLLFTASSLSWKFPLLSHCTALGECVYFCLLRSILPRREEVPGKKKLLLSRGCGTSK